MPTLKIIIIIITRKPSILLQIHAWHNKLNLYLVVDEIREMCQNIFLNLLPVILVSRRWITKLCYRFRQIIVLGFKCTENFFLRSQWWNIPRFIFIFKISFLLLFLSNQTEHFKSNLKQDALVNSYWKFNKKSPKKYTYTKAINLRIVKCIFK